MDSNAESPVDAGVVRGGWLLTGLFAALLAAVVLWLSQRHAAASAKHTQVEAAGDDRRKHEGREVERAKREREEVERANREREAREVERANREREAQERRDAAVRAREQAAALELQRMRVELARAQEMLESERLRREREEQRRRDAAASAERVRLEMLKRERLQREKAEARAAELVRREREARECLERDRRQQREREQAATLARTRADAAVQEQRWKAAERHAILHGYAQEISKEEFNELGKRLDFGNAEAMMRRLNLHPYSKPYFVREDKGPLGIGTRTKLIYLGIGDRTIFQYVKTRATEALPALKQWRWE